MTKRFKGGLMSGTTPTITTSSASGFWNVIDDASNVLAGTWPGLQYPISYLVVGGGGGGTQGAGGAGGLVLGSISISPGTTLTVTVGSGGQGYANGPIGANGGDSKILNLAYSLSITGLGGGGGGSANGNGANGGSGGGAGGNAGGTQSGGSALQPTQSQSISGVNGTASNYGYGGANGNIGAGLYPTGSGGGAGGPGTSKTANGPGYASLITGSSVTYAAGGVGTDYNAGVGASGAANTGNGGNGGGGAGGNSGGTGGSGIVIFSYLSATQRASGGIVSSYSYQGVTYWVHSFITSGTFTS